MPWWGLLGSYRYPSTHGWLLGWCLPGLWPGRVRCVASLSLSCLGFGGALERLLWGWWIRQGFPVDTECTADWDYSFPVTGWPQFGKKKIQGLFKDLKLTFPDLFRQRFCQVTEVLIMSILESMQCFGIKRKPLGSTKNKISNLTQQVMLANPL